MPAAERAELVAALEPVDLRRNLQKAILRDPCWLKCGLMSTARVQTTVLPRVFPEYEDRPRLRRCDTTLGWRSQGPLDNRSHRPGQESAGLKNKTPPLGTSQDPDHSHQLAGGCRPGACRCCRALRRHGPQARIAWIVEDAFAPLAATSIPDLDRVIRVRLRAWRKRPLALADPGESSVQFLHQSLEAFRSGGSARPDGEPQGRCSGGHDPGRPPHRSRKGLSARTFQCRSGSQSSCGRRTRSQRRQDAGRARRPRSAPRARPSSAVGVCRAPHPQGRTGDECEHRRPRQVLIHPGAGWDNKRYPPAELG